MKQEIREHSFQDETYQIGVDFDGVIHKCSKGFYDGTIYDPPIKGSYHALEALSEEYDRWQDRHRIDLGMAQKARHG